MMTRLFVNLKRFDVPRRLGGVSDVEDPAEWTRQILRETERYGVYDHDDLGVVFLLPESALGAACAEASGIGSRRRTAPEIGSQGVYRDDVRPGGNFGAFSSNRPAAAVSALGCTWTMIGHSEERADKEGTIAAYDPAVTSDGARRIESRRAVDRLVAAEVRCAVERGLHVLLCIGEKSEERLNMDAAAPDEGVFEVLAAQLDIALDGIESTAREIVIGYEPVWAIGPGKTPPDAGYIGRVSSFIRDHLTESFGRPLPVVYGGGLKEENAQAIGSVPSIEGGLVALTRFTGSIGFYPEELETIVSTFLTARSATRE